MGPEQDKIKSPMYMSCCDDSNPIRSNFDGEITVLIINGAPRSGKDTFIQFLQEMSGNVYAYSSIDWVKRVAHHLGWDGKKDERGRNFLSEIKDASTRYDDIPFKKITDRLGYAAVKRFNFFCVNVREPEEIKKLKSHCISKNIPCYTVRILNQKAEKAAEELRNTGDAGYMNYNYNYFVANNSSIEHFRRNVAYFLDNLRYSQRRVV